ncbi:MAG: hypothetical protein D6725_10055 [Planctomycetota bacterium]|nr:MAG: hypothetical protein D6725_10055 [Planctomycetota bacterium]
MDRAVMAFPPICCEWALRRVGRFPTERPTPGEADPAPVAKRAADRSILTVPAGTLKQIAWFRPAGARRPRPPAQRRRPGFHHSGSA